MTDPSMLLAAANQMASTKVDLFNTGISLWEGKKNREFAKEQSELAYERGLDMWNRANEYNKPVAQMGRLKEAGLNPNLIYGNVSNMPAVKSPEYQPAKSELSINRFSAPTAIQTFQQARMNEAQIKQMELQNELLSQKTKSEQIKQKVSEVEGLLKAMGLKVNYGVATEAFKDVNPQSGMWQLDKQLKEQQIKRLKQDIKKQLQQMDEKELDIAWKTLKKETYDKYKINIDKDSSFERKIAGIMDYIDVLFGGGNKMPGFWNFRSR